MKKKESGSISSTLALAFSTITIAALLVAGAFQIYIHGKTSTKTVFANQELIAKGAAKSVVDFIEEKFNIMETALSMGRWDRLSPKECRSMLESLFGRDDSFRNLVCLDAAGKVNAAVSRKSQILSGRFIQQIDRELVSRLKQTRRYISPVSIDPETYEPLIILSMWITNIVGDVKGVLAIEVNLKFIWDLVDALEIGKTGQSYVVNRNGDLLAAKDISRVIRGENMAHISKVDEFVHLASPDHKMEVSAFKGMNGSRVVGTAVGLGTPDWAVVTELPVKEAYRNVINSIYISVIFLLLTALASAWVGLLIARRLADPLVHLAGIASRIAGGQQKLQAPEDGPREILLLARSFNRMTGQLQQMLVNEENRANELQREMDQRKQAEREIRKAYKIINKSPYVVFLWKNARGWPVEYVSRNVEKLFGYSAKDFISEKISFIDTIHSDDLDRVAEEVRQNSEVKERTDFIHDPYRIITKTGEVKWIHDLSRILRNPNGEISHYEGIVYDITERKLAEEELHRLRNYLSNIIDSMPSILVGVDKECRITQWNNTAEQSTGIDADTAHGQTLSDILPWMASQMNKITGSIRTGQVIREQKRACRMEDGTHYEDLTIYPLITNGIEGAVIRIDDVTEKVRLEEMMIQSEKMLSVGGLAAGMAHEINNPLAGMMQTAEVMANRLVTDLDIPASHKAAEAAGTTLEAIERFMAARGIPRMLSTINESGRRVAVIVENMLNFARKSEATDSTHDLGKLLDKTLDLAATDYDLKKQYDFKRIAVEKEYADPPVFAPCKGAKIQQVILNILRNGAEAMQEAETESPRFVFRTRIVHGTGMAVMEIEDNGPGMDEGTRKRVFEPFFTTKPVGVGTGLGLSVSYFIITENHGGEMAVESTPGKGTKFIIRLPMAANKDIPGKEIQ